MEPELIYEDERYDDVKVWKMTEDDGRVWVKYDRFPDIEYEYLEEGEAERRILLDQEIRGAYIPSLTRKGFEDAIEQFKSKKNKKPGHHRRKSDKDYYNGLNDEELIAKFANVNIMIYRSIIIKESIIKIIDLRDLTIGEGKKEHSIDISYYHSYRQDKIPNEILSKCNFRGVNCFGKARFANTKFYSKVNIEGSEFRKETDFSGVFFEESISFRGSNFFTNVFFERAIFCKEANFNEINIGNKVLFKRSLFFSKLVFNEVNCHNEVTFENCYFNKQSKFNDSKFSEKVSFDGIFSCELIKIKNSTFKGDCSFEKALLSDIYIEHSTFEKVLYMKDIVARTAHFNNMLCMKHFYFLGDDWKKTIEYMKEQVLFIKRRLIRNENIHREKKDLNSIKVIEKRIKMIKKQELKVENIIDEYLARNLDIIEVDFWDCIVQGDFKSDFKKFRPKRNRSTKYSSINNFIKDFKLFKFLRIDGFIKNLLELFRPKETIENTTIFHRNTLDVNVILLQHRIALEMERFRKIKENEKVENKEDNIVKQWELASKQYSWLKNQYNKQGDYDQEDTAHWWDYECKTRKMSHFKEIDYIGNDILEKGNWIQRKIRIFIILIYYIVRWSYREFIGYGVRIFSIPLTIVLIILLSSILYYIATFFGGICLDCCDIYQNTTNEKIFHAIYFSFITFATVGYGDIAAVHGWRIITMIEGLLGVFLNAAFVVVLFRKIVR